MRQITSHNFCAKLDFFVDDLIITAEGTKQEVADIIVESGEATIRTIRGDFRADIAL